MNARDREMLGGINERTKLILRNQAAQAQKIDDLESFRDHAKGVLWSFGTVKAAIIAYLGFGSRH